MKVKSGYILREVAGSYVVLPVGEATIDFNGMVSLNETGAFLFEKLKEDISEDALVEALLENYEIDEETARKDVDMYVSKMKEVGIIE